MPEAYTYLPPHKYVGASLNFEIATADPHVLSQFLSAVLKDSVTLDIHGSDGHICVLLWIPIVKSYLWILKTFSFIFFHLFTCKNLD